MKVKPKSGSVMDPAKGDLLPKEGREVEPTQYWYRREAEGSVEIVKPKKRGGRN